MSSPGSSQICFVACCTGALTKNRTNSVAAVDIHRAVASEDIVSPRGQAARVSSCAGTRQAENPLLAGSSASALHSRDSTTLHEAYHLKSSAAVPGPPDQGCQCQSAVPSTTAKIW